MKTRKLFAWSLPALLLACGSHAVDLEGERVPQITASIEPGVVALIDEQVTSLGVDDERLYWAGTWQEANIGTRGALRSCQKTSCANSLITYDARRVMYGLGFFLLRGEVFWLQTEDQRHATLHACSVAGCDYGSRSVTSFVLDDPTVMIQGADAAYVSVAGYGDYGGSDFDPAVYRISLGLGDTTPTVIDRPSGVVLALAVHDDYLYWLEAPQRVATNQTEYFSGQMLQRTLADGSGSPQLLANNLILEGGNAQRLIIDRDYAYWSENELYGSISRCPLRGCADPSAPEAFLQPVRSPTTLWLDAGNLYWAHDTSAAGYGISACRISSCTPVAVVAPGLGDRDATTFDDTSVYAAATAQETSAADGSVTLPLRRFPKVVP